MKSLQVVLKNVDDHLDRGDLDGFRRAQGRDRRQRARRAVRARRIVEGLRLRGLGDGNVRH